MSVHSTQEPWQPAPVSKGTTLVPFLDLPGELVDAIWKSLTLDDVWKLSGVNRALRLATEALRYHDIELKCTLAPSQSVARLLRNVLARPEIAHHVNSVRLTGQIETTPWYSGPPPAHPASTAKISVEALDMAAVNTLIRRARVSFGGEWSYKIKSGSLGANVTLLLTLLHNVQTIHMDPGFAVDTHFLGMALRSPYCEAPTTASVLFWPMFRCLESVTLTRTTYCCPGKTENNALDVLPLFYLPNAQHLSLSIDNPTSFAWPADTPVPSCLTYLELNRIRECRLGPLLSVHQSED
ncbi:hypothetical protein ACHAQA_003526 [Verticillium albo-atrum]